MVLHDRIVDVARLESRWRFALERIVGDAAPKIVRDVVVHIAGNVVHITVIEVVDRDPNALEHQLRSFGKAFEHSAPCTELATADEIGHPNAGAIWLKINGETRQEGDLNQLIWKIPEMISYLSDLFTLHAGDIILTGTPAGVGPVQKGDNLHGYVEGVGDLKVKVV